MKLKKTTILVTIGSLMMAVGSAANAQAIAADPLSLNHNQQHMHASNARPQTVVAIGQGQSQKKNHHEQITGDPQSLVWHGQLDTASSASSGDAPRFNAGKPINGIASYFSHDGTRN